MKRKPKIDLGHPLIKSFLSILSENCGKLLDASQRIENAVLPIYCPSQRKQRTEHIGSCVAVELGNEYFLFSASHVFENFGEFSPLIGLGEGALLAALPGDRFSSARGKSGTHIDDPIDASVFHITGNVPEKIARVALNFEDLDTGLKVGDHYAYGAAGFRCSKTKRKGRNSTTKYELFPSAEYEKHDYSKLKLDPKYNIALVYEDMILVNGRWQISPTPKGFSGGAIIHFLGAKIIDTSWTSAEVKPLLSAITIAHKPERRPLPGALIGTRIGVHLGLIATYLPGLWDDITVSDSSSNNSTMHKPEVPDGN